MQNDNIVLSIVERVNLMPSWGELLTELQPHVNAEGAGVPGLDNDQLRDKYLNLLYEKTGRNVIAYYSGWLKPGKTLNIDINDSDVTGFMNALKGLDCTKGLDLILHTPGGSPTACRGNCKIFTQQVSRRYSCDCAPNGDVCRNNVGMCSKDHSNG